MGLFSQPKRIYLDYAAATPLHKEVLKVMQPFLTVQFGNASAVHEEGRIARDAIETARTDLARMLHIRPKDVTFTANGTESNNLAIVGYVSALHNAGRAYEDMEVIGTRIEHPSILETLASLKKKGVIVHFADVEKEEGRINEDSLRTLLNTHTVLVTYAYVNSEIGVVQDVKRISRIIKKFNAEKGTEIKSHLDASQAPLWLPCQMDMLGVDLMTLDAGKCYGPKGIGVLARVGKVTLLPIIYGGGQEGSLRPGTESPALIVGAAASLLRADAGRERRVKHAQKLQDAFLHALSKKIPEAVLNGSREHRVANNVHISLPGFDSEFAAVTLDTEGIAVSTRSACGSGEGKGSYVVRVIADDIRARSTLRFTFGEETRRRDPLRVIASLRQHLDSMNMYAGTHLEG